MKESKVKAIANGTSKNLTQNSTRAKHSFFDLLNLCKAYDLILQ